MQVLRIVRLAIAACVLVAAGSSFASAEIVFMTSGRTVSVKNHANLGDSVVLTLRSGGEVTLDKTLIETDCPYLAPVPHRGGRNEPAFVAEVARVLAELHGADLQRVAEQTDANFCRLTGLN